MAKNSFVPPPPPTAPSLAMAEQANPFDALFDDAPQQPQANPFDALFEAAPAPQPAPVMNLQGGMNQFVPPPPPMAAPTPAPAQKMIGVPQAPAAGHGHGKKERKPPSLGWQAVDDAAGGIIQGLQNLPGGFGRMGQAIVQQGQQRAAEEKKFDPVTKTMAGLVGLAHGPLQFGQDAYNATIGQLGHGSFKGQRFDAPPAHFADQFLQLPGVRVLSENLPGITGVASMGAGAAIPAGPTLATKGLLPQLIAGTLTGGAAGYAGSAGQQYGHDGKVDQRIALEDAGAAAALGAGLVGVHGGAAKLANRKKGISLAKEQPAEPAPQPAPTGGPIVDTTREGAPGITLQRKDRSFAPGAKEKLEARDAAEASPFDQATSIKQFSETVNQAYHGAADLADLMQAKDHGAKWIKKNVTDKTIKTDLETALEQQFGMHKHRLAQKRDAEINEQMRAATERPAQETQPKQEEPAPVKTKEQEIDEKYPKVDYDLAQYDFSKFKGTHDVQYKQPFAEGFSARQMDDANIDSYLTQLDATENQFITAYESADKNARTRISGMRKQINAQREALVQEKTRRAERRAAGIDEIPEEKPFADIGVLKPARIDTVGDSTPAPRTEPAPVEPIDMTPPPVENPVNRPIEPEPAATPSRPAEPKNAPPERRAKMHIGLEAPVDVIFPTWGEKELLNLTKRSKDGVFANRSNEANVMKHYGYDSTKTADRVEFYKQAYEWRQRVIDNAKKFPGRQIDGEGFPRKKEVIDYTKLTDDQLHQGIGKGQTEAEIKPYADELERRYAETSDETKPLPKLSEPEPETVTPPEESAAKTVDKTADIPAGDVVHETDRHLIRKDGPIYRLYEKGSAEPISTSKNKKQLIASAEKRDAGAIRGSQGQRTDKRGITFSGKDAYTDALSKNATQIDRAKHPEIHDALEALSDATRAYHQARAEYRGWENAYRRNPPAKGISLRTKARRIVNPEAEAIIKKAAQDPATDPKNLSIEVNALQPPDIPERNFKPGDNYVEILKPAFEKLKAAEAAYDDARSVAADLMMSKRTELGDYSFNAGKKYPINARFSGKSELRQEIKTGGEVEISHDHREVMKHLKDNKIVTAPEEYNVVKDVVDAIIKDPYIHGNPVAVVASQTVRVLAALKRAGQNLDPRVVHQLLMHEMNSDKYARLAHPDFYAFHKESMGRLDLALQGVEKLRTADERTAWLANRNAAPEDIRAGENGADMLSPAQREALIRQNAVLDDMADAFEQYAESLKEQGYTSKGPKALVGKNNLLRTLESDLVQLNPRKYRRNSNAVEEVGKASVQGIYDMYVTGNWPIHALHAIEASSVGIAYHPEAFKNAIGDLANSPAVREFVESFESSSGNMKRIKEENVSILGDKWRKLQKQVYDTVAGQGAADKLAHNKKFQLAGDILEGSIAEVGKLHLLRAQSGHIAAKEMNYPGGGAKLMEDMVKVLHDPAVMPEDLRIEAAARMAHHMNQMIGYAPAGFSDLNIFGRIAAKTGPWAKWFAPFTTTRITQSRVMTKFFTQAAMKVKAGDLTGAALNVGQAATMLGIIGLVGGRAAVPREIQDALHAQDPHLAKEFLEAVDQFNAIGRVFDTEVEHVTPQFFVLGYIGDDFLTQVLRAGLDVQEKEGWVRARALATILAGFGIGSVADRIGGSTIIKIARALEEGTAGEQPIHAAKLGNTLDARKHSMQTGLRWMKKLGVETDVPKNTDMLESTTVPTNVIKRLYDTAKPGMRLDAAHFVNAVRDDRAYGDWIRYRDEKFYKTAAAQLQAIRKTLRNVQEKHPDDKERIEELHERMHGFWERQFEKFHRTRPQQETPEVNEDGQKINHA